jgi:uncharacterized GH25 family protein
MPRCLRFLAAACLWLAAPALLAHEFWMLPDPPAPAAGQAVQLSLHVGEQFTGVPVAFTPELVAGFRHLRAGARTDVGVRTLPGAARPDVRVPLDRPGTHLLVLDTHPSFIELEAEKFNEYLRQEGLLHVLKARERAGTSAQPGRERYRRNVKALVQVGGASDATFSQRTGQRLEIVPRADPFRLAAPAPLGFEVRFDGRPLRDALLKVWRRSGDSVTEVGAVTDRHGRASFTLPQAGTWMASVVHMVPTSEPGIDWDSYWGNLTFTLPPAPRDQGSIAPRR